LFFNFASMHLLTCYHPFGCLCHLVICALNLIKPIFSGDEDVYPSRKWCRVKCGTAFGWEHWPPISRTEC
jgi:hypothetical protein